MSTINVTNIKGKGGASPNLPDGVNVTGVVTATSFVGSGEGLTGVASTDYIITGTAATFNNLVNVNSTLKVTGITTLGNLEINKSAAGAGATVGSYTGVTTYYGDGQYLSGVGQSIAPWDYNPDINDLDVPLTTGIGITFNTKVLSGSGTATIKIVSAGVAGTTIQSWGVSSCTFSSTVLTLGSLVSSLNPNAVYQLDIPEGFIVDSGGKSYAGTAYTFATVGATGLVYGWKHNEYGQIGVNDILRRSSPTQVSGTLWDKISGDTHYNAFHAAIIKNDGTLWAWGRNQSGQLGQNQAEAQLAAISSPVQVTSSSNWAAVAVSNEGIAAVNSSGELYTWGSNDKGGLGQNSPTNTWLSSPTRVGSDTTWGQTIGKLAGGYENFASIKTDGTYWIWGSNTSGHLGQNSTTEYSSPKQVGSASNWSYCSIDVHKSLGINSSNELYAWGKNQHGQLGLVNNRSAQSTPQQIPGNWSTAAFGDDMGAAVNTDGELFVYGVNSYGQCAQNNNTPGISSPVQVGSDTTWGKTAGTLDCAGNSIYSIKTDGTLWGWGYGGNGAIQTTGESHRSSPVQLSSGVSDITAVVAGGAVHQISDP